ncbi:MAG TPA: CAP domain-containing protein [Chthonomonadaceae bacterium]|nr:CAP domain-containing protein [Chthonomonadaceae bacterium]
MRSLTRRILLLLILPLLTGSALSAPGPADEPSKSEARFIRQVVALTNTERAKQKLPPLKLDKALCTAARWLAQDMADHDYFSHTDRQGRSIDPRLPDFGYKDYETLGENIAAGHTTPEEVFAEWMRSPDHRANLLDPHLREIGVGYAQNQNARFKRYWVQDFGARLDGYPVVINDESGETHSPDVKLTLYGDGWAKKLRLSNDGQTWTVWEPFKPQHEWKLPTDLGKHTVYVELNNGETTKRAEDTVELVEAPMPPARHANAGL